MADQNYSSQSSFPGCMEAPIFFRFALRWFTDKYPLSHWFMNFASTSPSFSH